MADDFDLSSAKPTDDDGGFDLSTAKAADAAASAPAPAPAKAASAPAPAAPRKASLTEGMTAAAQLTPVGLAGRAALPMLEAGVSKVHGYLNQLDQMLEGAARPVTTALGAPESATHQAEQVGKSIAQERDAAYTQSPAAAQLGEAAAAAAAGKFAGPQAAAPTVLGRVGQAAGGGALLGGVEPASGPVERTKNVAMGGGVGAGLGLGFEGLSRAKRTVGDLLFGHTGAAGSPVRTLWKKAKDMGFDISPQQAREDAGALQTPGVTFKQRETNRLAANTEASTKAGAPAGRVDKQYIGDNFKRVGAEYDKLYPDGSTIKVDADSVSKLRDFLDYESRVGYPWANRDAMAAARRLVDAYEGQTARAGVGKVTNIKVDAGLLRRVRTELSSSAAKSADPVRRQALGDVVSAMDESVARNHPEIAAQLKVLNPQYRTLVTLDNLAKAGGVENGNVSPQRLYKLLRDSDYGYTRGLSKHPLADLAEIGETFGLRGINEPEVAGGQSTRSGDVASRTNLVRRGIELGKEHTPFFRSEFEKHKMGLSGRGLSEADISALNALSPGISGAGQAVGAKVAPMFQMSSGERKDEPTNR